MVRLLMELWKGTVLRDQDSVAVRIKPCRVHPSPRSCRSKENKSNHIQTIADHGIQLSGSTR